MNNIHFSSLSCEWATPQWLFDEFNHLYKFDMDVCATKENTKCNSYFTKEDNALIQNWGTQTVWMNPPYGRGIKEWVKKAHEAAQQGAIVVCLLPSRTDTSWWHEYVMKACEVLYIRGRLKFGDSINSAPFPSCIVIFKKVHDEDNIT